MKKCLFALLALFVLCTGVSAKVFRMKGGNTVNGRLISSNQTMVTIEDERGNTIQVPYGDIDFQSIRQQEEQESKIREMEKAQADVYRGNALSIDGGSTARYLTGYGAGTGITWEIKLNSWLTLSTRLYGALIAVYYIPLNSHFDILNFVPGIEFKWYPFGLAPRDLWISGVLQASMLSAAAFNGIVYSPAQFDFLSSLNVGYKIVFAAESGFFIEPLIGIGYSIGSTSGSYYEYGIRDNTGDSHPLTRNGLFYDFGLRIGFTM